MPKCLFGSHIEGDLWEIWEFIDRDNPDAADRVVQAARETFLVLAANPGLGRRQAFDNPRLKDLRSRPILGFENYLIFYRPIRGGAEIIRVLNRARNIPALLRKT